MNDRSRERFVVAAGVAYLVGLSWSMANVSYDIWGAIVVTPILLIVGAWLLRSMFTGSQADLYRVMVVGMLLKVAGGLARYWVSFDAYGGGTDAQRYHTFAADKASAVWSGEASLVSVFPSGTGTQFMEGFAGLVYTLTGTSRLGAFMVFAWISFWGIALFVKAAVIAVPDLARHQYAVIMVLAPSVVFWPSSIGKEAYMYLTLGIATFGIARLLSRPGVVASSAIAALGLGAASFVRTHLVVIWMAGLFPALLVMLARGRAGRQWVDRRRTSGRFAAALLVVMCGGGLYVLAHTTVEQLAPGVEEVTTGNITDILGETTRLTSKTGSTFVPPSVESPSDWPFTTVRTLFRPLLSEANGAGQLLAAAELTALLGLFLVRWRRLINVPRLLVTNPYVAFSVTSLLLTALAYSSFANLGVLTRQKSLLFPFLLLIACLPERGRATRAAKPVDDLWYPSAADRSVAAP
jgi:hypothetical protein